MQPAPRAVKCRRASSDWIWFCFCLIEKVAWVCQPSTARGKVKPTKTLITIDTQLKNTVTFPRLIGSEVLKVVVDDDIVLFGGGGEGGWGGLRQIMAGKLKKRGSTLERKRSVYHCIFAFVDDYLMVFLPGHLLHLLNCSPERQPCHHIILQGNWAMHQT